MFAEVVITLNLGRETEQVEFKRSTSEMREAMESIASILNKHTSGVLYFGVRNDGMVIGQDANESTLRKVSQAIGYAIEPRIYPEISLESTDDDKAYVKVEFEGRESPYACNGRYRIRVADEDVIMSHAKLRELMGDSINRHDPWDRRTSDRRVEDVDEPTLVAYVERGRERGRIEFSYAGVERTLESLGLLCEDGTLTNTADILFCRQHRVGLKMGIVESHTRTEVLDLHQEIGTVFDLVDRAEYYILNNTRRRLVITGSRTRDEVPEIPRKAVREALMNAYAHRIWYESGYVQVEIYSDAVEITSPGWFINGQDPIAHLEGRSTSARTRNELLTYALFRSGDIESYGMGMRAIRELCDGAGVGVEYRNEDFGTKVVFHRNDAFGNAAEGLSDGGLTARSGGLTAGDGGLTARSGGLTAGDGGLTDIQRALVETLGGDRHLTLAEVARELGLSKRKVERVVAQLKREGRLERVGSNKSGSWVVHRPL